MRKLEQCPVALTIAGVDSGGGAGLAADLRAFAALGVHGVCAVTCLTAQNPVAVRGIRPSGPAFLRAQLEAVFDEFAPGAIKTGMLFSASMVREVVAVLAERADGVPLVVDPVTFSTSGSVLLKPSAVRALTTRLLPRATVMTPNVPEAAAMLGRSLANLADLREGARELQRRFGCAVLLKGGHLAGAKEATDVLWDGGRETLLREPFIRGATPHGAGCALSAALAAGLARGESLSRAVRGAKAQVTAGLVRSVRAGRHEVLKHFPRG